MKGKSKKRLPARKRYSTSYPKNCVYKARPITELKALVIGDKYIKNNFLKKIL
jgi:hypothetical protein